MADTFGDTVSAAARNPADHGQSMFRGAFGPVVKLGQNGLHPARPANIRGVGQQDVGVDDAVPLNLPYQP